MMRELAAEQAAELAKKTQDAQRPPAAERAPISQADRLLSGPLAEPEAPEAVVPAMTRSPPEAVPSPRARKTRDLFCFAGQGGVVLAGAAISAALGWLLLG